MDLKKHISLILLLLTAFSANAQITFPPSSPREVRAVWLTVAMAVYATAFFAYKFFVENVGVSVRNVSVVVITYVLVFLVWLVNRLAEKKRTESEGGESVR